MSIAKIGSKVQKIDTQQDLILRKVSVQLASLEHRIQKTITSVIEKAHTLSDAASREIFRTKKSLLIYKNRITIVIKYIWNSMFVLKEIRDLTTVLSQASTRFLQMRYKSDFYMTERMVKEHGRGIPNITNSCYLNSLIQVFRTVPYFRNFLKDIEMKTSKDPGVSKTDQQKLCLALQSFFTLSETYDQPFTTKMVQQLFKDTPVLSSHIAQKKQEDAPEFFAQLAETLNWQGFDVLAEEVVSSSLDCPIPKHKNAIDHRAKTINISLPQENRREPRRISLQEAIKGDISYYETLDEDDIRGILEQPYFTNNKGNRKTLAEKENKRTILTNALNTIDKVKQENRKAKEERKPQKPLPDCLPYTVKTKQKLHIKNIQQCKGQIVPITLKRFEYDKIAGVPVKNSTHVKPEMQLKIPLTASRRNFKVSAKLELQAVIAHHGSSASSGHYTTYKRDGNSFIQFDDNVVRYHRDIPEEILRSGYMFFYVIKEIVYE